jgi:hypothetical protein
VASFGKYGPMPLRFGGGTRAIEAVHRAHQEALEPFLDVTDEDGIAYVETYADASVMAEAWKASQRLRNQLQPAKMLESLPVWEEATRLRVGLDDTEGERRSALAGKFRGLSGNAIGDIRDACALLCGANFVALHTVAPADEIVFWPGVNPGPPGLEWSSNRATVYVELTKAGLDQGSFDSLVSRLLSTLDDLCPSWLSFAWFTTSTVGGTDGFFLDYSLLGQDAL